jgi:amidase
MTDLIWADAVDLLRGLADRRISSRELTAATLDRIEAVNQVVNAIVSARPRDEVMADAAALRSGRSTACPSRSRIWPKWPASRPAADR